MSHERPSRAHVEADKRSECFGRIAEKLTVAPQPPAGCDRMSLAHVSPTPRMLAGCGREVSDSES
jgi:hypothetical protein